MAYILFVNPAILGSVKDVNGTSLPFDQILTVTALAAGIMTLVMGLFANYPFALAAGLGLNAFVTFTLVATNGLSWPAAMGSSSPRASSSPRWSSPGSARRC
jgi:AGZA family xanthine/uracil permease-like MFS transporter